MPALSDTINRTYVIAYQEDVTRLVEALGIERLNPTVLRSNHTVEELTYSRMTRCFVSHHRAWQRAAEQEGYTFVCEADFVPCIGLGGFPTFWPLDDPHTWGYVYQGSPRLLALIGERPYLRGHSGVVVAYVINKTVARVLCDFFDYEMGRNDPTTYFTFDAHLQWWLMQHQCRAFMPLRHYGEHGGLPNPEHRRFGIPRAGTHRADNLAAPLHFLPQYSLDSKLKFMTTRAWARLLGFARLFTNRWIIETDAYHIDTPTKLRMLQVGLQRLF